jgi:hypothetical protein
VRIAAQDPMTTYNAIQFHGLNSDPLVVAQIGIAESEVRLVVSTPHAAPTLTT